MDKLQPGRAPVYEMLEQYRHKGNISYHVPGHKNGEAYRSTVSAESAGYLTEVMRYDVTEITGTDDLHHPEGVIRRPRSWQPIVTARRRVICWWAEAPRVIWL